MLSKRECVPEHNIRRYSHFDDLRVVSEEQYSRKNRTSDAFIRYNTEEPKKESPFFVGRSESFNKDTSQKSESSSSNSAVKRSKSFKVDSLSHINSNESLTKRTRERNCSEPIIDVSAYSGSIKRKSHVSFKELKTMSEVEQHEEEQAERSSSFNSADIKRNLSDTIDKIRRSSIVKSLIPENDKKSGEQSKYVSFKDDDGEWTTYSLKRHYIKYEPFDFTCKVMLLGDSGVGKTCLLTKFKDKTFLSGTFISTVGIDFRNKVVDVDDTKVKLQIWDTAGQERFRSVTHAYYRDAHALLLLYDVGSKKSFDNTRAWLAEVHEYAQDDVVIMLIGNKSDIEGRVIRMEDGQRLAREYNVAFMETSAKTGLNVDLAFIAVARELKFRKSTSPGSKRFNVADYVQQEARRDQCIC